MIGGAIWALSNVSVVPIVDLIGLSLGMLLWGVTNMATGWCVGTFGVGSLLSADPAPSSPVLNYVGFGLAVASIFIYLPIKSEVAKKTAASGNHQSAVPAEQDNGLDRAPLLTAESSPSTNDSDGTPVVLLDDGNGAENDANENSLVSATPLKRKAAGISLALVAGFGYGINMLPVRWVQEHQAPTANPLSFAFSHFVGVWLASTVVLAGYSIVKRNAPLVNGKSILAALLSGIGWAIAMSMWFIANSRLGLATAFPIICTGPSVIATLWGVGYFREIRGLRNLVILAVAFVVTLVGIALIALSHAE